MIFDVEMSDIFPGKVILHHNTRVIWDRDMYLEPVEALQLAMFLIDASVTLIRRRHDEDAK